MKPWSTVTTRELPLAEAMADEKRANGTAAHDEQRKDSNAQ